MLMMRGLQMRGTMPDLGAAEQAPRLPLLLALPLLAAAVLALSPAGTAQARGLGAAAELEAARANARAGGPVSSRDAELLERHGCLSGTDSAFCRRLERRGPASYQRSRR